METKISTSPPLKSRSGQGISFLTQVIAALEKSFQAGYIIPHSGYSLPEGEFRSCQEGRPAANDQRACVLSLEEKRLGMEGCI